MGNSLVHAIRGMLYCLSGSRESKISPPPWRYWVQLRIQCTRDTDMSKPRKVVSCRWNRSAILHTGLDLCTDGLTSAISDLRLLPTRDNSILLIANTLLVRIFATVVLASPREADVVDDRRIHRGTTTRPELHHSTCKWYSEWATVPAGPGVHTRHRRTVVVAHVKIPHDDSPTN